MNEQQLLQSITLVQTAIEKNQPSIIDVQLRLLLFLKTDDLDTLPNNFPYNLLLTKIIASALNVILPPCSEKQPEGYGFSLRQCIELFRHTLVESWSSHERWYFYSRLYQVYASKAYLNNMQDGIKTNAPEECANYYMDLQNACLGITATQQKELNELEIPRIDVANLWEAESPTHLAEDQCNLLHNHYHELTQYHLWRLGGSDLLFIAEKEIGNNHKIEILTRQKIIVKALASPANSYQIIFQAKTKVFCDLRMIADNPTEAEQKNAQKNGEILIIGHNMQVGFINQDGQYQQEPIAQETYAALINRLKHEDFSNQIYLGDQLQEFIYEIVTYHGGRTLKEDPIKQITLSKHKNPDFYEVIHPIYQRYAHTLNEQGKLIKRGEDETYANLFKIIDIIVTFQDGYTRIDDLTENLPKPTGSELRMVFGKATKAQRKNAQEYREILVIQENEDTYKLGFISKHNHYQERLIESYKYVDLITQLKAIEFSNQILDESDIKEAIYEIVLAQDGYIYKPSMDDIQDEKLANQEPEIFGQDAIQSVKQASRNRQQIALEWFLRLSELGDCALTLQKRGLNIPEEKALEVEQLSALNQLQTYLEKTCIKELLQLANRIHLDLEQSVTFQNLLNDIEQIIGAWCRQGKIEWARAVLDKIEIHWQHKLIISNQSLAQRPNFEQLRNQFLDWRNLLSATELSLAVPALQPCLQLPISSVDEMTCSLAQLQIGTSEENQLDEKAIEPKQSNEPPANILPLTQALTEPNCVVHEIQKHYSEQVIKVIQTLLFECEQCLGQAPCAFHILGLGSVSRYELVPGSDIDFAILVEADHHRYHPYFKTLIYLWKIKLEHVPLQFRTTLESSDITELFDDERNFLNTPQGLINYCLPEGLSPGLTQGHYSARRPISLYESYHKRNSAKRLLSNYQYLLHKKLAIDDHRGNTLYQQLGECFLYRDSINSLEIFSEITDCKLPNNDLAPHQYILALVKYLEEVEQIITTKTEINLKLILIRPLTQLILNLGRYVGCQATDTTTILTVLKQRETLSNYLLCQIESVLVNHHPY